MPCRDYQDSPSADTDALRKQNDRLARIACKAMDILVETGNADLLLTGDDEVRNWYTAHKEADRKAQEEARRRKIVEDMRLARIEHKKKLIQTAMSKLTPEEKEALLGNRNSRNRSRNQYDAEEIMNLNALYHRR